MEQRLDRIEQKLDKVVEIQADMTASLREHIRRTEIAEFNIEQLAQSIKPIQEHVALIRGFGKLITAIITGLASLAAVWQIFFRK